MNGRMKAILHYRAGPRLRARAASLASASLEVIVVDEDDDDTFMREIADANVLLHVLKPVTQTIIRAAPRLKLIQKIGVGVNTIDLAAAKAAGVRVANMPGTNSQAVAEHALALILAVLRRVPYLDLVTRRGEGWLQPPEQLELVGEVAGRTIGFIGYGEVPKRLSPMLKAMGGTVVYTDVRETSAAEVRTLDDLLNEADIVSLHVPSTAETKGMFNQAALDKMKPGAILINTARGDLVDEQALHAALFTGKLLGAGLDVYHEEPALANCLFDLPNVVLTPHVAWLTPETIERSLTIAIQNIMAVSQGKALLHEVT